MLAWKNKREKIFFVTDTYQDFLLFSQRQKMDLFDGMNGFLALLRWGHILLLSKKNWVQPTNVTKGTLLPEE